MPKPPGPSLTVVTPGASISPPRKLGSAGASLWRRIQDEYGIRDAGGIELLALACQELDRAEQLAAGIEATGAMITTRTGVKANPAVKDELAARAFIARTLERLGVTVQNVQPPGRPGGVWSG